MICSLLFSAQFDSATSDVSRILTKFGVRRLAAAFTAECAPTNCTSSPGLAASAALVRQGHFGRPTFAALASAKGGSALLRLCHPACPERSRRDWRAATFAASPPCHPACPERNRRDRSGPIFSSAPPSGASGRAARFVRPVRFAGVEGSWQYSSTKRWRVGRRWVCSSPAVSSRPQRSDLLFRAAFWRVGPRSGGIAALPFQEEMASGRVACVGSTR